MIADELFISFETVHSHISRIYRKLHVNSVGEAVSKTISKGYWGRNSYTSLHCRCCFSKVYGNHSYGCWFAALVEIQKLSQNCCSQSVPIDHICVKLISIFEWMLIGHLDVHSSDNKWFRPVVCWVNFPGIGKRCWRYICTTWAYWYLYFWSAMLLIEHSYIPLPETAQWTEASDKWWLVLFVGWTICFYQWVFED